MNSHKQSGTPESGSLRKKHTASTTRIHLYIHTTLGLSINKHWAALNAYKMEMILLKPKVRGIKKLVGKYNFWSNCHKERLAGELLQECSWQEHHKLWQNIKYAQAAKCKLTWQGFTATRGSRIAYLNLIQANITKGSIFIIHGSAHNAHPSNPTQIPPAHPHRIGEYRIGILKK